MGDENRNPDGTFKEGHALSTGRPKGARNKTTMMAEGMIGEKAEQLTQATIDLALAGDTTCLKICMERIYPGFKPRAVDDELPDDLGLPEIKTRHDIWAWVSIISKAVSEKGITPTQAETLCKLVDLAKESLPLSF